ncbi:hypothetical protein ECH_0829 [Ehrlichia chaffeensis str. Arkansas]|uniref:Uncharacterized protein n=1 Tax=Ehrlichia chaffeensis (strain ATCC CRL-10679 / Arkansas) TaxID=205920 RepID=Q2GG08_EHRCR|nr:hypothetical protein ECH_0829 [Ehrlichia chaffeensis str. Arkansas]
MKGAVKLILHYIPHQYTMSSILDNKKHNIQTTNAYYHNPRLLNMS